MKANEAPEKIWINPSMDLLKLNGVIDKDSVVYIRKDVFIEKVCKYLQENCTYTHPRKGIPICAVNLTLLKEYLGGEAGLELAKDIRYKENLEVKEVDLDTDFGVCWGEYCDCGGNINDYEVAKHFFELGLKAQKGE